jgi:hypothetical protein
MMSARCITHCFGNEIQASAHMSARSLSGRAQKTSDYNDISSAHFSPFGEGVSERTRSPHPRRCPKRRDRIPLGPTLDRQAPTHPATTERRT